MDVSVILPVRPPAPDLGACLAAIAAQRYDAGRIEVLVVAYGDQASATPPRAGAGVDRLAIDHPSPYAARNLAASRAGGDALLFTEPDCVPDPGWVAAHVDRLRDPAVTISVGLVVPEHATRLLAMFDAYENERDAWVFSGRSWRHHFGRPRNMAVTRARFDSDGPFEEVARGADSTFVQRVTREISCAEVAFTPDAIVRQRYIRGMPSRLQDRFRNSRAMARHRSSHAAPIAFSDRVGLFREAVGANRYGPLRAVTLLLLLGAGVAAFRLGAWSAAASRARISAAGPRPPARGRAADR